MVVSKKDAKRIFSRTVLGPAKIMVSHARIIRAVYHINHGRSRPMLFIPVK